MTPAEAFDLLKFSPILQAICGVAWFAMIIGIMLRAERDKRTTASNAPAHFAPHMTTDPQITEVIEILREMYGVERHTCTKIDSLKTQLIVIGESMKQVAAIGDGMKHTAGVRERQLDEMITAIKKNRPKDGTPAERPSGYSWFR